MLPAATIKEKLVAEMEFVLQTGRGSDVPTGTGWHTDKGDITIMRLSPS